MNKIRLLYLGILSGLCLFTGCRQEFDDHYKTKGESTVSENIVEILRKDPDFSLFVSAIDRLNLASTLGEASIYTCLAQKNKDVEAFLQQNNYPSIEAVPLDELTVWMNYHWITGMHYIYDIDAATKNYEQIPDYVLFFQSNDGLNTRKDSKHAGKQIRIYTPLFLQERSEDYHYLKNITPGTDAYQVESVPLSDRKDIDASNGVIHVLDGPLNPLPRADQAIARDPELSILNMWLEKFAAYKIGGIDDHGKIDTTKTKYYTLDADIADETKSYTIIAPTDQALHDFFDPYISNFSNYDSIPKELIEPILTTFIAEEYWGMSDINRGNRPPYYFRSIGFTFVRLINDIQSSYVAGLSSSNAMIYKVNKLPVPPVLHSVEGGIYLNRKRYEQWNKMRSLGYVRGGMTDNQLYNHPDRTILIQSDETWLNTSEVMGVELMEVDNYPDNDKRRDTVSFSMSTGILNVKVSDGDFKENTFYPSNYGSIFYKDGAFTDYTGKSVQLVSKKPTWEAVNGSIYEIDGFLTPLLVSDTNQNLYNLRLKDQDDYNLFRVACERTGMSDKLKESGYFQYTIFAPTDEAFGNAGINSLAGLAPEELKDIVERHIIQRKIFTDGAYNGTISTLNGELLTISGSWDGFTITDETGQAIGLIPGQTNLQANNGVFHGISVMLKKKDEE